MNRYSLDDLARRCQKPDYRTTGNWMARRISRPAALHVTRVVARWSVSANLVTLTACACGVGAAIALGWGTIGGWLLGALLLQSWYLLDHVDGQLARLRGTASLDGVQLDYLMHHFVDLLVPLGVGWGLFVRRSEPWWLLGGLVWGLARLLIAMQHDARYKAFFQRLKRVRGRLIVEGGGGGRPAPPPPIPRRLAALTAWTARKSCESHVLMNLLTLAAVVQWLAGDTTLVIAAACLILLLPLAILVATASLIRSQRAGSVEQEFAAWFRVDSDSELILQHGWWTVRPVEERPIG